NGCGGDLPSGGIRSDDKCACVDGVAGRSAVGAVAGNEQLSARGRDGRAEERAGKCGPQLLPQLAAGRETVQSIALVPCPERAIRRPCEPAGLTELARTIAAPPETSRSSPDLPACSLARRRWRPHEDGDLRYARIEQDQRVAPEQEVVG